MNGPDHYREAERLLDEATSRGESDPGARWCLELLMALAENPQVCSVEFPTWLTLNVSD
jgi:hypothetical protein